MAYIKKDNNLKLEEFKQYLEDNKKCNSLIKKIKQIINDESNFNTVDCENYFYEQLIRIINEQLTRIINERKGK